MGIKLISFLLAFLNFGSGLVYSQSCNFELNTCKWSQLKEDKFDWTRNRENTPSSGTGPSHDHSSLDKNLTVYTTGGNSGGAPCVFPFIYRGYKYYKCIQPFLRQSWCATTNNYDKDGKNGYCLSNGYYMYIETSEEQIGDNAILISPLITTGPKCFSFWYHMYGRNIGTLNVYSITNSTKEHIWKRSGAQGNIWRNAKVLVGRSAEYRVMIEGIADGYLGGIAIDDLSFSNKSCEYLTSTALPHMTTPTIRNVTTATTRYVTATTTTATLDTTTKMTAVPNTTIASTTISIMTTMITEPVTTTVLPRVKYYSCRGLAAMGKKPIQSGLHSISLPSGKHEVYCEMGINGGGYTFLPSHTISELQPDDMKYLFTDREAVLLRLSNPDGTQPYTVIHRLNTKGALSVQLTNYHGYTKPVNHHLGPYIYLGTIPKIHARNNDEQGFRSNGHDISFTNCDKNPNNYFAFFPNPKEQPMKKSVGHTWEKSGVAVNWRNTTIRPFSGRRMPLEFFLFTEVQFGGCGCYTSSDRWMTSVHPAHGTAIGVR